MREGPCPSARRHWPLTAAALLAAALVLTVGCSRVAPANRTSASVASSASSSAHVGTSTTKPSGGTSTSTTGAASKGGAPPSTAQGAGGPAPTGRKTIPQTGATPLPLAAGLVLTVLGAGVAYAGWQRLRAGRRRTA